MDEKKIEQLPEAIRQTGAKKREGRASRAERRHALKLRVSLHGLRLGVATKLLHPNQRRTSDETRRRIKWRLKQLKKELKDASDA